MTKSIDWRFVFTVAMAAAVSAVVWQLLGYPARR